MLLWPPWYFLRICSDNNGNNYYLGGDARNCYNNLLCVILKSAIKFICSYFWVGYHILGLLSVFPKGVLSKFLFLRIVGLQMGNPISGKQLQNGTAFMGQCRRSTIYAIISRRFWHFVRCITNLLPEDPFSFLLSLILAFLLAKHPFLPVVSGIPFESPDMSKFKTARRVNRNWKSSEMCHR